MNNEFFIVNKDLELVNLNNLNVPIRNNPYRIYLYKVNEIDKEDKFLKFVNIKAYLNLINELAFHEIEKYEFNKNNRLNENNKNNEDDEQGFSELNISHFKKKDNKPKKIDNKIELIRKIIINKNIDNLKYGIGGKLKNFFVSLPFLSTNGVLVNKTSMVCPIYIYNNLQENLNNKNDCDFLYFSYRYGFINMSILDIKNNHNSDCGWGCMYRCAQMILSAALMQKKIKELQTKKINIDKKVIKKNLLFLFYDNYIPININYKCDYLYTILQKISSLSNNRLNTNINDCYFLSPYSIHMLSYISKSSGNFTSNLKMVNAFIEIHKAFFNEEFIMVHYDCYINKQNLIKDFCEKLKDDNNEKTEYLSFNKEKYIFKKGGIIFISFRLGLKILEEEFIDIIPLIFYRFRNNVGFISGEGKRAYYFIGLNGNKKLIYVDPHMNQEIIDINNISLDSYNINEFYLLDIHKLASSLTLCIEIYDVNDFNILIEDLTWFNEWYPSFITFKYY